MAGSGGADDFAEEEMSEKVIFLDIDGPMIPSSMYLIDNMCSFKRLFPPTTVAVLNRLCEASGARVVFNTTHNTPMKDAPDIEVALVNHGLKADHVHPNDCKTRYPTLRRGAAINEWLGRHPETKRFVAFDDTKFTDQDYLIWVDPDAGLHVGHYNEAAARLDTKPMLFLV